MHQSNKEEMPIVRAEEYGIGLIVCDIEGCLNSGKTRMLDITNLSKINLYNRNSVSTGAPLITLLSGRPQPFVEAYANLLAVYTPCICENGALAYFPGEDKVLYHEAVTPDVFAAVSVFRDRLRRKIAGGLPAQIEVGKEVCTSVNPIRASHGRTPSIPELEELLAGEIDSELLEVTHSGSAVDVTPKGINKASGLAWLSQLHGTKTANMIGIGDSIGDLGFLEMVGYSGAPANASDAIRAAVQYVSKQEYVLGVIDVIDHFLGSLAREFDERVRH